MKFIATKRGRQKIFPLICCWIWDPGSGIWDPGSGIWDPGSGSRDPRSRIWVLGWKKSGSGISFLYAQQCLQILKIKNSQFFCYIGTVPYIGNFCSLDPISGLGPDLLQRLEASNANHPWNKELPYSLVNPKRCLINFVSVLSPL